MICWLAVGSSASSEEDAAVWCVASLPVALRGMNARPVWVVCAGAPAAVLLPETPAAGRPVAALAICSALDNCDSGDSADSDNCADSGVCTDPENRINPEVCADPEVCIDLENCADPVNGVNPGVCADPENCVVRESEGAKLDSGADVVSAVCASVGICDRTGEAGIWIGASIAGAIACALTAVACAVFSGSAVGAEEPARLRFAVLGRAAEVEIAPPVDVV